MRFGFAFGETFVEAKRQRQRLFVRLVTFYVLGAGLLVLIMGRLIQLQLVEGAENRNRADSNRVQLKRLRAPRGTIFDRNGEALTRNVPVYKLKVQSGGFKIISREEAERLRREGEEVVEDVGRVYPEAEALAHVVGFVGEVSQEELDELADANCQAVTMPCYRPGDVVGKMGVEKQFESVLKGRDGGLIMETGAKGEVLRQLGVRQPEVGADVTLTIDLGLQKKVTAVLADRPGAVVVSNPQTSEVLALASSPGFDPNLFSGQRSAVSGQRQAVLEDERKPLFNRALAGLYPPGSVFKIVTAVAGLEEGQITAETEIEDTGEIRIGKFRYGNWYFDQYGKTEGFLDVVSAIKRSNDIFFYKVGERVGADKLAFWAKRFGLSKLVNLGLAKEAEGVVPSPGWKETVKGERWFLGNTYHLAIGQGDLQVTPLQLHQMVSVIAADGRLCRPKLVQASPTGQQTAECEDLGISRGTLALVTEGMVEACKPRGTAFPFFNFSTSEASASGEIKEQDRVACKTGTAQFGDSQGRTHAWFSVFGPVEEPEILVTVLLEAAGEGSYEAAPVAKEILDYWFHERR